MPRDRIFVKLFLVDQHGSEAYQMSTLVLWPENSWFSTFLYNANRSFEHPGLRSVHDTYPWQQRYSVKCAVRDGGDTVWTHVCDSNWVTITPQDTLGIFLPYVNEDAQDGYEPGHVAKDLGAVAKKRPRLAFITCDEIAPPGADGILIPFPETYKDL
ncbi:unnamed protein product [Cyclocybe aegerita]|uniref:Uncharacterized protein n=1 Tax=Cyclocybe aegerita TaxID=1973307 RepID=A0A8S0VRC7_CYCAE|nr:unnamed protein product [Cyclocybe aegerita]